MPELPEVETVRRTLLNHIKDRHLLKTEILYPKMIKSDIDTFLLSTKDVYFKDIERKGKFLIFILSNDMVIVSHLRMEGKFMYFKTKDTYSPYVKVVFYLDNDDVMVYDDMRCFGIMELHSLKEYRDNLIPCLKKLGQEPFYLDENTLHDKLKNLSSEIKTSLLNQDIISGLGNIYVDETLFDCKISPFRKSSSITIDECRSIILSARKILLKAIDEGGSTIDSYHPENGVDGKFQNSLLVYGKEKKPCSICNSLILKRKLHGRGTHFCPRCQKVAKVIGIYGKIASGKSTVCNFISQFYPTFSSDEYINSLYKTSLNKEHLEFKQFLIKTFSEKVINDNLTISKGEIKNQVNLDNQKKIALENYLYPLLRKAIHEFIKEHESSLLIFIEIPLLFEKGFRNEVDYVLGVDCSYLKQIEHLKARNSKIATDLKLNQDHQFDKNINKIDYVIFNSSTIEDLKANTFKAVDFFINR